METNPNAQAQEPQNDAAVIEAPVTDGVLNETPVENGVVITITKGEITLDKDLYKSQYQKPKTLTAQVRQVITSSFTYPERQIGNNMEDSLFDIGEFGFEKRTIESHENRIAFLEVPEAFSVDTVKAMLKTFPNAVLYKVLSNEPILTDNQLRAIANPDLEVTKDQIANSQAVRYSVGATDKDGNDVGGELILRNGRVQYRAVFFKRTATPDIDDRTTEGEAYMTPELNEELFGATLDASQHI